MRFLRLLFDRILDFPDSLVVFRELPIPIDYNHFRIVIERINHR